MNRILAIACAALLMSGCMSSDRGLPLQTAQDINRVRSANLNADYILAPNDEISLAVYGEPDLTRNYKIGPGGAIELPLVGQVKAAGLTIDALAAAVQTQLGTRFLQNPSVAGSIVTYRPFYILGEVNKPDQYPFTIGLTLESAVALGGGFTYRAQMDYVFIQPEDQDEEVRVKVSPQLIVRPGDRIRVAERYF
jgi:protein involved in polysaccharide export with SLBB domain